MNVKLSMNLKTKKTCSQSRHVLPLYSSGIGREEETLLIHNQQWRCFISVAKTYLEQTRSSARDPGVRCTLYEARNNIRGQKADEERLLATLKESNPNIALAQIMIARSDSIPLVENKFGKSPQGSYASYQLAVSEDNFKVFCDITSVPRGNPANHSEHIVTFPLSSQSDEQFEVPADLSKVEKS